MPLTVTVTGIPTTGTPPLAVYFSAAVSGGFPPYSFEWTFGDGDSATSQETVHTYAQAGTYEAMCTVTDSIGDVVESGVLLVTVSAATTNATYTILPGQVCAAGSPAPLVPIPSGPGLEAIPAGALEQIPGFYYDRCLQEYIGTVSVPTPVTVVTSVAAADSTLNIPVNTGAVTAALNLGNPNTWSAKQTFGAGIDGTGSTGGLAAGAGILGGTNTWTSTQKIIPSAPGAALQVGAVPTFLVNTSTGAVATGHNTLDDGTGILKTAGVIRAYSGTADTASTTLLTGFAGLLQALGTRSDGLLGLDPAGNFGGSATQNNVLDDTTGNMRVAGTLTLASSLILNNPADTPVAIFANMGLDAGLYWRDSNNSNALAMTLYNFGPLTVNADYTLSVAAVSNSSDSRLKPDWSPYPADPLSELDAVRVGGYSRMGPPGHAVDLGSVRAGVAAETLPPTVRQVGPDGWSHIRSPDSFAWSVIVMKTMLGEIRDLKGQVALLRGAR